MIEVAAGIDIGGTNSVVGLVEKNGNIYNTTTIPTLKYHEPRDLIYNLHISIQAMLKDAKEELQLTGIGIGAPNANYYRGSVEDPANLPWKGIIPVRAMFSEYYDLPVIITNDANAAAVGEMIYGGARGMKDFVVLTLGTGLGSGIIVNGDLVYGNSGFAGELGHMIMFPDGRQCGCGRKGCLETYVSATGICRTVSELIDKGFSPGMLNKYKPEQLNSLLISEAAEAGDKIALEAFERTAEVLAIAIANTVVFTSPEAIFLFGGLSRAGKLLMDPLKKWVAEKIMLSFKDSFKLLFSSLENKNAAVLGSSALVWKEQNNSK